jgi:prepilin-type N-terminal cleavage/methylation domain-containing protein
MRKTKKNKALATFVGQNSRGRGFTLIEILVVIGLIAILAAVVLIAINPARQFRQANNSQRTANVNAILNAVGQYAADHKGDISDLDITSSDQEISSGGADLCDALIPNYMPALPADPSENIQTITKDDCDGTYSTGYNIQLVDTRVVVSAPETEDLSDDEPVDEISVTR